MKGIIPFLKFLLIIVVAVQHVLLSLNISSNRILLSLIDGMLIIILIYFLIRSINNIQMYIIYIYSIVTKITIIFFASFPKYINSKKEEDVTASIYYEQFSRKVEIVTIAILVTIVVYILLFYITNYSLLNIHTISIENILFFLIITHVSIDFLDVSDFFCSSYFYFYLYYFRLKEESTLFKDTNSFAYSSIDYSTIVNFYSISVNAYEVIFILFGVVISLNISLHAYSLPNYSYEATWGKGAKGVDVTRAEVKPSVGQTLEQEKKKSKAERGWNNNMWYNEDKEDGSNGEEEKFKDKMVQLNDENRSLLKSHSTTNNMYTFPSYQLNSKDKQLSLAKSFYKDDKLTQGGGSLDRSYKSIRASTSKGKVTHLSVTNYNYYINEARKTKYHSKVGGDAMSCLKYISIYSFIFTDLIFLVARLFNSFVFSVGSSSSFFVIKNVCFIIIHGSRIYRKSKFLNCRRSKKRKERREELTKKKEMGVNQSEKEERKGNYKDSYEKEKIQDIEDNQKEGINSLFRSRRSSAHLKESYFNLELISKSIFSSEIKNFDEIKYMDYKRVTSLNYEKIKAYFFILYFKYKGINIKKYASCYVDNIEQNSSKFFIIFLFFFLLISLKITILVITYTFNIEDEFKKSLYQLTFLYNLTALKSCFILKIYFLIIISYVVSSFFVYSFICSIFDAFFMSFLYFFNLVSYSFILIIISQYNPSYDIFSYFNRSKNFPIVLCVFVYLVYLFLNDTYMFIYMLLGRKYITYKYRINTKKRKRDLENTNIQREEVYVSVSVISSLVVKLIKYMKGPLILNKLIIGNNFIKNTRLDNYLFFCHFKEITVKLIIYFSCSFLLPRYNIIKFSFILQIFIIDIFVAILYLILSKVYRNTVMDCVFAQAAFTCLNRGEDNTFDYPDYNKSEYGAYSYDYFVLFDNSLNYF
ncbi:conserved Plasmodium protein, unknown function [Plasmodium malariae]|uniref:Uncharacterized protein n=1 Tax=Plasmodium malariae TaxID=5858 RepID=A0A1D3JJ26_PLAMA|nr:conserved Plasmodium protein, unknown function [Plasmodium malariae]SBT86459.1 conserved Plasmodium protein, unknown function [Plasmodium malariae]